MSRRRLCLNLVCKDEEQVIERCLRSVLPIVDSWCVVDTGSTDSTREIIRGTLANLPGRLYRRVWKNFGHNKTEALRLAREHAEYALLIDADDMIVVEDPSALPIDLDQDAYDLRVQYGSLEYDRPHVVRTDREYRYVGVCHEYLDAPRPSPGGRLEGLRYQVVGGGARSRDPDKYLRDAEQLLADLKTDPENARTMYYLAQSYRDAGRPKEALHWFRARAARAGFPEETFMALLEAAKLTERLGSSRPEVIAAYLEAWQARPERAEPLYELARYLRGQEWFSIAYELARLAAAIPRPDDVLFVDREVYSWRALDEVAVNAYRAGRKAEAAAVNRRLIEQAGLPDKERLRTRENLEWCSGRRRGKPVQRLLVGSPVRQTPQVLEHFLRSLGDLRHRAFELDFAFVDDNTDEASSQLLARFCAGVERACVIETESQPSTGYARRETSHCWDEASIWRVARFKDDLIQRALCSGYDGLFLVDSDLVLQPRTLEQLVAAAKPIVSTIFWTSWQPGTEPLPQVWLSDEYTLYPRRERGAQDAAEIVERTREFLDQLRTPGLYEVGGLGSCTLISREALEAGVRFARIDNLSFWGEDRHFCIRARALGLPLFVDTHYPALHLYRDSDLEERIHAGLERDRSAVLVPADRSRVPDRTPPGLHRGR